MLIIIVFQTQNKCFVGIDYIIYYVGCGVRYSQGKSCFSSLNHCCMVECHIICDFPF